MSNSLSLSLFVLVIVFVVGWFAAGTYFNIRRGHKVLEWLQQGLTLLGERTSLRWLGSAVVELRIAKAKQPFREAEIVSLLNLGMFHCCGGTTGPTDVATCSSCVPSSSPRLASRSRSSTRTPGQPVDWNVVCDFGTGPLFSSPRHRL